MTGTYRLIERAPTYEECLELFLAVGWDEYITEDFAHLNLEHYFYYVVVEYEAEIVGMGRIVQRKGLYHLENIAVLPAHQGQGVGRMIMTHLMSYLKTAVTDEEAEVILAAMEGTQGFYEKFGFKPFAHSGRYMHQYLHKPTPEI